MRRAATSWAARLEAQPLASHGGCPLGYSSRHQLYLRHGRLFYVVIFILKEVILEP